MAVSIQELSPGDELQCWMRLGLAIHPTVNGRGEPYFMVPSKPQKSGPGDLTRFLGWVITNEPDLRVITLQISIFNASYRSVRTVPPKAATIAYTALQRVRRFSKTNLAPRVQIVGAVGSKDIRRPGSIAGFGGTDLKPYRTLEDISLQ